MRRIASTNVSNSWAGMSWPMPSMSSSSVPGTAEAVARPPDTWTILSASPWMTIAGMPSERSGTVRLGWVTIASIWRITPLAEKPRSKVSSARRRRVSASEGKPGEPITFHIAALDCT